MVLPAVYLARTRQLLPVLLAGRQRLFHSGSRWSWARSSYAKGVRAVSGWAPHRCRRLPGQLQPRPVIEASPLLHGFRVQALRPLQLAGEHAAWVLC